MSAEAHGRPTAPIFNFITPFDFPDGAPEASIQVALDQVQSDSYCLLTTHYPLLDRNSEISLLGDRNFKLFDFLASA